MKNSIKSIALSCSFAILSAVSSTFINSAEAMEVTQINPQLPKYILLNAFYSMSGKDNKMNDMLNFSLINKKCLDVTRMALINPLFDRSDNDEFRIKNLIKELAQCPNVQTLQVWKIEDLDDLRVQKFIKKRSEELKLAYEKKPGTLQVPFLKIIVHKATLITAANYKKEIKEKIVRIEEFTDKRNMKNCTIGKLFPALENLNLDFCHENKKMHDYITKNFKMSLKILKNFKDNPRDIQKTIHLPALSAVSSCTLRQLQQLENEIMKNNLLENCIFVIKQKNSSHFLKSSNTWMNTLNAVNDRLKEKGCRIYIVLSGDINLMDITKKLINNNYVFFDIKNCIFQEKDRLLVNSSISAINELDKKYLTKFGGKLATNQKLRYFGNQHEESVYLQKSLFKNFSSIGINNAENLLELIDYINSEEYNTQNHIKRISIDYDFLSTNNIRQIQNIFQEIPPQSLEFAINLGKQSHWNCSEQEPFDVLDNLLAKINSDANNPREKTNIITELGLNTMGKTISIGKNNLKSLYIKNSIVHLQEASPSIKSLSIYMYPESNAGLFYDDSKNIAQDYWMNIGRIQDLINKCPNLEELEILAPGNNDVLTTEFNLPLSLKKFEKNPLRSFERLWAATQKHPKMS